MTQEEKELLLKDLCSRLPYNVKCLVIFDDGTKEIMTPKTGLPNSFGRWDFYNENCSGCSNNFKPYLRPMDSMTDEEKEIYKSFCDEDIRQLTYVQEVHPGLKQKTSCHRSIDWLNEHYFDYRGLIEKGLALEATENMYQI